MPDTSKKFKVYLSAAQRKELEALCRRQSVGAAKVRRARILLMSDMNHSDGQQSDRQIAETVGLCERQVVRIRQQYVREGQPALERKPRPPVPPKLDGKAEAALVTLCCGRAPEGRERWTLQLLCDELARLQVVESVSRETVRRCLKKMNSNRGEHNASALPSQTAPDLSRGWKKSSKPTTPRTTSGIR